MVYEWFINPGTKKYSIMAAKGRAKKAKKSHKSFKKVSKYFKNLKPKNKILNMKKKPKKPFKTKKIRPKASKKPKKPAARKPKPAKKPMPRHAPKPKAIKKMPAAKGRPALSRADEIIEKIKSLEVQGANDVAEAGVRCLETVAKESRATNRNDFVAELKGTAEKAMAARPTEPALRNSVRAIMDKLERYELRKLENVRKYALSACGHQLNLLKTSVEKIARIGAAQIQDSDVILTHCHSENVVAILKEAKANRKNFSVIVTETMPLRQGMKTAKELLEAKIEVTFIVDSAVASVMKKVTKVLMGCDAILADGSVVNKIGSYSIALIASRFETPVFVAGETLKFDPQTIQGVPEQIEQRKPDEIVDPSQLRGATILNPAFDITPAELVTAMITEKGIMRPELVREAVGKI
jgi:ribose 1,5-bisphosphate isomerase